MYILHLYQQLTYSYSLPEVDSKADYVKLVQYDMNGVFVESGVLAIDCKRSETLTVSTYPNPSAENFFVKINGASNTNSNVITLRITDFFGRELQKSQHELSSEAVVLPIDASLQKGTYVVELTDENGIRKSATHCVR